MPDDPTETPESIEAEIESRKLVALHLQQSLYTLPDPTSDQQLAKRLADEQGILRDLERRLREAQSKQSQQVLPGQVELVPRGRLLGPSTTGFEIRTTLRMMPIPTGVYHLLNPETDPLVLIEVRNNSREVKTIVVRAYLEWLSAKAISTVEVNPRDKIVINLLPTLIPRKAASIKEAQRFMLHVIVAELDGKYERHNSYPVVCLARNSSFNSVRDPATGRSVDLTPYYGAWVTPHDDGVQQVIRRATEFVPSLKLWSLADDQKSVDKKVEALFSALKELGITYMNSTVNFGTAPGQATQHTKLPRECLSSRMANCMEGSLLFASMLEGCSLCPGLALVPGHAFVAWETCEGWGDWRFLETTLIGSDMFSTAREKGERQHELSSKAFGDKLVIHRISDLRKRGIWPMA